MEKLAIICNKNSTTFQSNCTYYFNPNIWIWDRIRSLLQSSITALLQQPKCSRSTRRTNEAQNTKYCNAGVSCVRVRSVPRVSRVRVETLHATVPSGMAVLRLTYFAVASYFYKVKVRTHYPPILDHSLDPFFWTVDRIHDFVIFLMRRILSPTYPLNLIFQRRFITLIT